LIKHGKAPYLECSTKGDKRFSAFNAKFKWEEKELPAFIVGRSIEDIYQANKIFEDGSTGLSWREAKGKKAVNQEAVTELYSKLWDFYIKQNPSLLNVLKEATGLSDIFGQEGHCCQATELWRIRNSD
jgi:hypothetical protein